jgi:hypothetical protein
VIDVRFPNFDHLHVIVSYRIQYVKWTYGKFDPAYNMSKDHPNLGVLDIMI